ncbi:MAG: thioredoxin-like domain-containing protein [Thermoguttaceae bacterium]
MSQPPFGRRLKAPPLPAGLEWLNAAGPIELADLRGKFVLLDFWTYCCINCMHLLPELKRLERTYPDSLVVIGVHSAKFDTEQDSQNIAEAILRYQIEHPVINDSEHRVWKLFGAQAWPTLVLIDPEGYVVWAARGEVPFEQLDGLLKPAVAYYRSQGLLDTAPLRFDLESDRWRPTPLRFPGKVLADPRGQRLLIADSSHNRIVVARLDGTLLETIGSGVAGQADGQFASAQFNQPQGLALKGDDLYVADTANHLVRKVDLARRTVRTVAGVGRPARGPSPLEQTLDPRTTPLSSPWDLWIDGQWLYIAMAGSHQIWRMGLDRPAIGPYAGNGREDVVDGPLLPDRPFGLGASSFAQPSGLASDGTWLYVADSEGSSIRAVPLGAGGQVRTVIGTSHLAFARLFTFGDVDGPAGQARLQHPLGVVFYQGRLFVADTYNNKIKQIDPATGATRTLMGTGRPGRRDDPPQFNEPAGISAADGKLFVADTNNHSIRVVDLAHKKVSTLTIPGLAPPQPGPPAEAPVALAGAAHQTLAPVAVKPEGGRLRLAISLELPAGWKINPLAPMSYRIELPDPDAKASGKPGPNLIPRDATNKWVRLAEPAASFQIALPLASQRGHQTLRLALSYFYCRSGAEGLCKMGSVVWTVPVELTPEAAASVVPLRHQVR